MSLLRVLHSLNEWSAEFCSSRSFDPSLRSHTQGFDSCLSEPEIWRLHAFLSLVCFRDKGRLDVTGLDVTLDAILNP